MTACGFVRVVSSVAISDTVFELTLSCGHHKRIHAAKAPTRAAHCTAHLPMPASRPPVGPSPKLISALIVARGSYKAAADILDVSRQYVHQLVTKFGLLKWCENMRKEKT